MENIQAIAEKYNLYIIEDAAQAIGSSYTFKNNTTKKAGNLGTVGCFSCFLAKTLVHVVMLG